MTSSISTPPQTHIYQSFPPANDPNDGHISTAPTTPDGSLTFSPVLQAVKLKDALELHIQDEDKHGPGMLEREGTGLTITTSQPVSSVRRICCVGAGYVGGPTAAILAFQNPNVDVTVVDLDPVRIEQWKGKHLPIFEPGLEEILRIARDGTKAFSIHNQAGLKSMRSDASSSSSECGELEIPARKPNLFFSTEVAKEISEADIILIAVNTPTKKRGLGAGAATDMTALEAVAIEIAKYAKHGAILVEKSTVPCRTADFIRQTVKIYQPNLSYEVLSNPEFLSAATAVQDLMSPDRVLIGCSPTPTGHHAASLLSSIYESWIPKSKIITTNTYSSELSKLVSNAMLAQRISSINSISAICEKTGADIEEVSKAAGMDPRIGSKFLKSGVGFGGSCFQKDILSLCYLAEGLGLHEVKDYWKAVLGINSWQRKRWAEGIVRDLNGSLKGKKIAFLGFAFKGDTDDTRESIALDVIGQLVEEQPVEIAVWDPRCDGKRVREEIQRGCGQVGDTVVVYGREEVYEATRGCEAVCVLTECAELKMRISSSSTTTTTTTSRGNQKRIRDPRPFTTTFTPSENQILDLERYLRTELGVEDPLSRLVAVRGCGKGCGKCVMEGLERGKGGVVEVKVDWERVVGGLRGGKWVFDGRGVVDRLVLEELGCRVREVGRV